MSHAANTSESFECMLVFVSFTVTPAVCMLLLSILKIIMAMTKVMVVVAVVVAAAIC